MAKVFWKDDLLGVYEGLPTIKECRRIKAEIGMLPAAFIDAVFNMDPDAVAMFAVMMKARKGEQVSLDDIDGDIARDLRFESDEPEEADTGKADAPQAGPAKSGAKAQTPTSGT